MIYLAPLTNFQRNWLGQMLVKYRSVEGMYKAEIEPLIEKAIENNLKFTRLHCMRPSDLRKMAISLGLGSGPRQGLPDADAAKAELLRLQKLGWTIACKFPGELSKLCEMLEDGVRSFLLDKDLFILLISPVQAGLLRKSGGAIGTDGTHGVTAYGKIKTIVVSVSTYALTDLAVDHNKKIKERGFPCVFVLCNSEREVSAICD